MEEALLADLRANPGVIAATATHRARSSVDWAIRPELSAMPAVTLMRVSTDALYSHMGRVGLTGARIQIDCWATSYGAAKLLMRAVIDAMEIGGASWKAFLQSDRDFRPEMLDGGQSVFRSSSDFNIWYQE